jgi:hypothetical protein
MTELFLGVDADGAPFYVNGEHLESYSDEFECEESSDQEGEGKITLDHSKESLSEEDSNDELLFSEHSLSLQLDRLYVDDFQCQLTGLYQPI